MNVSPSYLIEKTTKQNSLHSTKDKRSKRLPHTQAHVLNKCGQANKPHTAETNNIPFETK